MHFYFTCIFLVIFGPKKIAMKRYVAMMILFSSNLKYVFLKGQCPNFVWPEACFITFKSEQKNHQNL